MLMQKSLGDALTNAAAPEASSLDIDLRGAVSTAIQNNRDITIADLQRKEAEADVSAAAAAKNPTVGYSWQGNQFKTRIVSTAGDVNNRSYSQGVNVTLPIWTGGKLEGQINQARYAKNIADLTYYKTEADTKLSAVKAYYTYLENIKLADVQSMSVNDYANHLKMYSSSLMQALWQNWMSSLPALPWLMQSRARLLLTMQGILQKPT